ncbi:hypothetical protein TRIP_B330153 [uncultured Desulfatiglans sp.]|nr:hypothetical protein TRIP_B330153 [uncultured Desulfatiglans sp.]
MSTRTKESFAGPGANHRLCGCRQAAGQANLQIEAETGRTACFRMETHSDGRRASCRQRRSRI